MKALLAGNITDAIAGAVYMSNESGAESFLLSLPTKTLLSTPRTFEALEGAGFVDVERSRTMNFIERDRASMALADIRRAIRKAREFNSRQSTLSFEAPALAPVDDMPAAWAETLKYPELYFAPSGMVAAPATAARAILKADEFATNVQILNALFGVFHDCATWSARFGAYAGTGDAFPAPVREAVAATRALVHAGRAPTVADLEGQALAILASVAPVDPLEIPTFLRRA